MNEKYSLKLFEQFKSAYGIKDIDISSASYDYLIDEWLRDRKKASKQYAELFEFMNNRDGFDHQLIAEVGKGIHDTVAFDFVNEGYNCVVVSPYADTFGNSCDVKVYNGKLFKVLDTAIIKYKKESEYITNPNCDSAFNDDIDTIMSQVPFVSSDIEVIPLLAAKNKSMFFGAYGSINDSDRRKKEKRVELLYDTLKDMNLGSLESYCETKSNCYVSAIKILPKPKQKQKLYQITK